MRYRQWIPKHRLRPGLPERRLRWSGHRRENQRRGREEGGPVRHYQGMSKVSENKQACVHFMSTGVYSFLSEEIRIMYLFKLWDTHHNPANIRENFFKSLNKLKCGYVDLYLIHWPFGFEVK